MTQFVDVLFTDFLLDNAGGACFVLCALASRTAPELSSRPSQTKEQFLVDSAREVFAGLFFQKTEECLEQHASFQAVPAGAE